ncbi:MAG: UTP--glucose-1-phosphate uridylyltransferase, partial [Proteobacteria bacterium]|nr:UTP--glucose-1-phosphate uridylyltransferase [Pseudomonadota bacterium]
YRAGGRGPTRPWTCTVRPASELLWRTRSSTADAGGGWVGSMLDKHPALELEGATASLLEQYGFDRHTFERLRAQLQQLGTTGFDNRVRGKVEAPRAGELIELPPAGSQEHERLTLLGADALRGGQVGHVVLAGGMATRFGGAVKAAVDALPGHTFLDLKLDGARALARSHETAIPVYLMTSFATDAAVRAAAETLQDPAAPVRTFPQFVSLRVTETGDLFLTRDGKPSPYAPGHGDLTFALRRSGVLHDFRAGGGRVLFMSNVDNLGATLDATLIGAHLDGGRPITAEVTERRQDDKGGAPARVDGQLQILEEFRFPGSFDPARIPVFNTNTFAFDAQAIDRDFDLSWFCVRKKVSGATAIQFERLVGQLTAFLPCRFVSVPREGSASRFEPVKDPAELQRRRSQIGSLLKARGVV